MEDYIFRLKELDRDNTILSELFFEEEDVAFVEFKKTIAKHKTKAVSDMKKCQILSKPVNLTINHLTNKCMIEKIVNGEHSLLIIVLEKLPIKKKEVEPRTDIKKVIESMKS